MLPKPQKFMAFTAMATIFALTGVTAKAADTTVSSAQTSQISLSASDTLTITSDGSLTTTAGTPAILIDNVTAGTITLNGNVTSDQIGVSFANNGGLTNGITVGSGATLDTQNEAILLDNSGTITGQIINNGTINTAADNEHGVFITNNASLVGGFVNNGTMTVGEAGFAAQDGGDAAGGFINNGTINSTFDDGFDLGNTTFTGVITNNGTINATFSASGDGIDIGSTSTITKVITNNGTINVSDNGFEISSASNLQGGIVNNGTITAGDYGLDIDSSTVALITNSSDASITAGSEESAIYLEDSILTGAFTNDGTVTTTNTGIDIASGFQANDSDLQGALINNGTITVDGRGHGIHLEDTDLADGITNNGTIISADADGIRIDESGVDGSNITGNVINNGTISSPSRGDGIDIQDSAMVGNIVNNGTISVDDRGIALASATLTGNINNAGTITVFDDDGIAISNTTVTGNITNSGTMDVDRFGLNLSNGSTITGSLTNTGTIDGRIDAISISGSDIQGDIHLEAGSLVTSADNAIDMSGLTSTLEINLNGGRVVGLTRDQNAANDFSIINVNQNFTTEGNFNVSTMNVMANKRLTISSGNTLTTRALSNAAGSTLDFGITSAASAGSLVESNAALDLTNAAVTARVTATNTLADGDEIMIADGNATIIGGPGATKTDIEDNSFLWSFQMADGTAATAATDDTDLFLFATKANTISSSGQTVNTRNTGTIIEALGTGGGTEIQNIVGNLNTAATQSNVDDILEATNPTVDSGAIVGGLTLTKNSFALAANELSSLRGGTGVASGDIPEGVRFWGQAFGQIINQNNRDGVAGYDADTVGLAAGVDTEHLHDDIVIGAAVSYAHTNVESENSNSTKSDINSYQVTVYGDYDINERTYIAGMVGYVYGENETTRYNVGGTSGLNARADYRSNQYVAEIETGKTYEYDDLTVTPSALMHYTHYRADDYTETGAGGANLSVDNEALNILELGIGLDATWEHDLKNGAILEPSINVGYRYDVIGDAVETSSRFTGGGGSFETEGFDPAQSTFNISPSLHYTAPNNIEVTASYDLEYKSDYTAHAGLLRVGYRF